MTIKLPSLLLLLGLLSILTADGGNFGQGTVIAVNGLNFREKPTLHSNKLGIIPFKTVLNIIDPDGPVEEIDGYKTNWIEIQYKNKTGWVFGKYIVNGNKSGEIDQLFKLYSAGFYGKPVKLEILNPQKELKKYVNLKLTYSRTVCYCYSECSKIHYDVEFKKEKILLISTEEDGNGYAKSEKLEGTYNVTPNEVKIILTAATTINTNYPNTPEYTEQVNKEHPRIIELVWLKKINGLIYKDTYDIYKDTVLLYDSDNNAMTNLNLITDEYKCMNQPLRKNHLWTNIGIFKAK